MPLDPAAQRVIDNRNAAGFKPVHTLSVEAAREQAKRMQALAPAPAEPVEFVEDTAIPGLAGPLVVRVYRPKSDRPLPAFVYIHGGGWVLGDLDTTDSFCRAVANRAECLVMSVDYRLAPEHPFPAPVDDCYQAIVWAGRDSAAFGGDPNRVAVGGTSAGGNLAAGVALMARDRRLPALRGQVLVVPATDLDFETSSYRDNAEGFTLSRADMQWYWNHYLAGDADRNNPYAVPIRAASLAGLAPALILTAEYDPLRDDGARYADALRTAGVPADYTCYDGMIHGFSGLAHVFPAGAASVEATAQFLRRVFA